MTTKLKAGESRRAYITFPDTFSDLPAPGEDVLRQIIAVEEVCPPGAAYTPPPLDFLTLFLTQHGHARLRVGSDMLRHQPGALIVVPAGSEIAEQVDEKQSWHVRYLLLDGSWADQMTTWLRRREPAAAAWTSSRPCRLLSEMIDLALTQGSDWQWMFLSRCAELWGTLYHDASSPAPGDALVLRVARLLDAAPAARLSVSEMATRLDLTPRQLIYRFHAESGEPLARWIRRRRVSVARRLLSQGQSVVSVAEALGFANPYHFSRTFKSVVGVTPSAVREAALRGALHTKVSEQTEDD